MQKYSQGYKCRLLLTPIQDRAYIYIEAHQSYLRRCHTYDYFSHSQTTLARASVLHWLQSFLSPGDDFRLFSRHDLAAGAKDAMPRSLARDYFSLA